MSEGRKLSASSRLSDGVGSGRSREGRCTFRGGLSLGVEGCHAKRAQLALNVPKNVQIAITTILDKYTGNDVDLGEHSKLKS